MWVVPQDIKDRWLSTEPLPDDAKIQVLIDDFESQVLNRFPDLDTYVQQGKPSLTFVVSTLSRFITEYLMAKATPYQQESQTVYGVGQRSITTGSFARTSKVLTEGELNLFKPYRAGRILALPYDTRPTKGTNLWGVGGVL